MTRKLLLIWYGSLAAAQHAPVGQPSGNPFLRPMNEVVPACKPFTISWQPTTSNAVSLVLLFGPAENVQPIQNLALGIANSGFLNWTPSDALDADATHYGLQLIDDVTGQYQYSTQFEIAKGPDCASSSNANTSRPSNSSSTLTGSTSTPAASSSSPAVTASDRPQDTSSRGPVALKPGIAAAIGVGTAAGVAIFAVAVFMAYRLGRRRDNAQQEEAVASDIDIKVDFLKPELHATSVGELHGHHLTHELHGSSAVINELASPVSELHDDAGRSEVDGGPVRKEQE